MRVRVHDVTWAAANSRRHTTCAPHVTHERAHRRRLTRIALRLDFPTELAGVVTAGIPARKQMGPIGINQPGSARPAQRRKGQRLVEVAAYGLGAEPQMLRNGL